MRVHFPNFFFSLIVKTEESHVLFTVSLVDSLILEIQSTFFRWECLLYWFNTDFFRIKCDCQVAQLYLFNCCSRNFSTVIILFGVHSVLLCKWYALISECRCVGSIPSPTERSINIPWLLNYCFNYFSALQHFLLMICFSLQYIHKSNIKGINENELPVL